MTIPRRAAKNHPLQVASRGPLDEVDDRRTPVDLFTILHRRYRFSIDVAASEENAMLPRFYSREQNGLERPWSGERVWCNPPFSGIPAWIDKAWEEMRFRKCELVVMLVPSTRTEQPWWQGKVEPFRDSTAMKVDRVLLRVEFLPGRIRFGYGGPTPPRRFRPYFGCCLLIWSRT